jgi:hypothetical protein
LAIIAQAILAILLANATAATLVGRRASNAVSHGRCPVPCKRPGRKQTSQIAIPLLADAAELFLAPARVLLGHEANPGCEVPSRPERLRISNTGDKSRRQRWADAGNLIKPPARRIGPVPGHDPPVKLENLGFQHPQLNTERDHACARRIGQPLVLWIGGYLKELLATLAARPSHDPELGEMGTDRIDDGCLLPDEEMTRAVEHKAALLLGRLGLHEPHVSVW